MELVSDKLREYRQKGFWQKFYHERSVEEVVEWYGSAGDFKPLMQLELAETEKLTTNEGKSRHIASPQTKKPSRNLSVLNCGYGALEIAERLHDDMAVRDICTLHGVESGIASMRERNAKKRPNLRFETLTDKSLVVAFGVNSFDWVIDRGCLDQAIMSCEEADVNAVASRHLENAVSVLKEKGKLFIITLAQDLVLKCIVQHFRSSRLKMKLYLVTLRLNDLNSALYDPVCLVVTNLQDEEALEHPMITVDSRFSNSEEKTPSHRITIYQLFKCVKDERRRAYAVANIYNYNPGNLSFFQLSSGGSSGDGETTEYAVSVYDRKMPRFPTADARAKFLKNLRPTIAILVPQADQHHWLYKTVHGHQRLCERAGCRRVICAFLPDFGPLAEQQKSPAETVAKIKDDLGRSLIELAVDKKTPVLLMTQQENFVDERLPVCRTESPFAGKIYVFDVIVDEDDEEFKQVPEDDMKADNVHRPPKPSPFTRRTMIFECNPRMAQTEIWYTKDGDKIKFDYLHVCHAYHLLLLAGLKCLDLQLDQQYKGAILGLGGGMLGMLLRTLFETRLSLTSVEIDPVVAEIAQKQFGYTTDDKNKIVVADAVEWVKNAKDDETYDFIVLDVNSSQGVIGAGFEGVSSPPPIFLQPECLDNIKRLLKPKGLLLVNSLAQQEKGRRKLISRLKHTFAAVSTLKYSEDLNQALICFKTSDKHSKPALPSELEDLEESNSQDIRQTMLKMRSALPAIQQMMDKTPMYLSKKSRFTAVMHIF